MEDTSAILKRLRKQLGNEKEERQTHILNQIENFNDIRKCLSKFKSSRDRLVNLSIILDACYGDDPNRIIICQLMEKCDEKYGVNAIYKDLSLEDQKIVLKYIF